MTSPVRHSDRGSVISDWLVLELFHFDVDANESATERQSDALHWPC